MAVLEHPRATAASPVSRRGGSAAWTALALAGLGLAGAALVAVAVRGRGTGDLIAASVALLWAVAGAVRAFRFSGEPLAGIIGGAAGVGLLVDGAGPAVAALLPAAGVHLLLGMPDGRLGTAARRSLAAAAYLAAGAVAARFGRVDGVERRHMKWLGLGAVGAAWGGAAVLIVHALVDWPPSPGLWAVGATVAIPVALLLDAWPAASRGVDTLFEHAVSLSGLSTIVAGVYVGVVIGLGRAPRHEERTVLVLSMIAAGLSALLYVPARARLRALAARLAHGGKPTTEDVVRTFGTRLSRSVPLDELMLSMAESLRSALTLRSAEMWTASAGTLELTASDPEHARPRIRLRQTEETTVARAGLSG